MQASALQSRRDPGAQEMDSDVEASETRPIIGQTTPSDQRSHAGTTEGVPPVPDAPEVAGDSQNASADPVAGSWLTLTYYSGWRGWARRQAVNLPVEYSDWTSLRRRSSRTHSDHSTTICFCVHPANPRVRWSMDWKTYRSKTLSLELQTLQVKRKVSTPSMWWRFEPVYHAHNFNTHNAHSHEWCATLASVMADAWRDFQDKEPLNEDNGQSRQKYPPPGLDAVHEFYQTWARTAEAQPRELTEPSNAPQRTMIEGLNPLQQADPPRMSRALVFQGSSEDIMEFLASRANVTQPPQSETLHTPLARVYPEPVSPADPLARPAPQVETYCDPWTSNRSTHPPRPDSPVQVDSSSSESESTPPPSKENPDPPLKPSKWEVARGIEAWSRQVCGPPMSKLDDFVREHPYCRDIDLVRDDSNCVLDTKAPAITFLWYRSVPSVKWAVDAKSLHDLGSVIGPTLTVELQYAACRDEKVTWESAGSFVASIGGTDTAKVLLDLRTAMQSSLTGGWFSSNMRPFQRNHCIRMTRHLPPDATLSHLCRVWAGVDTRVPQTSSVTALIGDSTQASVLNVPPVQMPAYTHNLSASLATGSLAHSSQPSGAFGTAPFRRTAELNAYPVPAPTSIRTDVGSVPQPPGMLPPLVPGSFGQPDIGAHPQLSAAPAAPERLRRSDATGGLSRLQMVQADLQARHMSSLSGSPGSSNPSAPSVAPGAAPGTDTSIVRTDWRAYAAARNRLRLEWQRRRQRQP